MFDFSVLNELPAEISGIFAIYAVTLLGSSVVGIVLFILRAIGLFKMSKALGLSAPWLGFIPVLSVFSTGRIAQKYVKRDGSYSAKFSVWLLLLYILLLVLLIALVVFVVLAVISIIGYAGEAIAADTAMDIEMFKAVIPVIILYFILMAIAIAYSVVYYIAVWRVYSIFSTNATLFLVLGIFFNFLEPIFMLIVSKNSPKLTYNERMGFEPLV